MRRAAVFDIDGTLVSFKFDVVGTRRAIYRVLSGAGFDTSEMRDNTPTQMILDQVRKQADSGLRQADYDGVRRRVFSLLDEFELPTVREAEVFEGVKETLATLRAHAVLLGVVTNSGRRAASLLLREKGLAPFFDLVLTRDEAPAMKPRPEGLLKAVADLGVSKSGTIYVGDSVYDILAARGAGIRVASISSGNYNKTTLMSERPDFALDSIRDVPAALLGPNRGLFTQDT